MSPDGKVGDFFLPHSSHFWMQAFFICALLCRTLAIAAIDAVVASLQILSNQSSWFVFPYPVAVAVVVGLLPPPFAARCRRRVLSPSPFPAPRRERRLYVFSPVSYEAGI
jgi:hypothetical protein